MLHFFSRDREDVQHFNHYLHDYISHRVCRRYCGISLEALEKVLDTFEEIDEGILAGFDIFGRL